MKRGCGWRSHDAGAARHHRPAAGLLWLALLFSAALAEAQDERGVEVRVGLEAPPRELIAGLDLGLQAWNVHVIEQSVESSCAPIAGRTDIRASVSLDRDAGGLILICFSTQERSFRREVGPFSSLHARAREELVTIVEAGLEALMEPDAGALEAGEQQVEHRGLVEVEGSAAPSGDMSDVAWHFPDVPPPRIVWPPSEPLSTQHAAWTLGVGYAPAFWGEDVVAQGVAALATRSIDSNHLFHLGARFAYAPAVHVNHNGAGFLARELQAELMFVLVAPLLPRLSLETSVAPGLTWLAVDPDVLPAGSIHDLRSETHLGPIVTAQLGPRLAVGSGIVLSAQIGCSAMLQAPPYGYKLNGDFVPVLEVQPIRLSFELGARIGL